MSNLVAFELKDKVAVVTMDDGKANALSHAVVEQLNAAIARAEKEAEALVLAGRPGRFCAGFDLKTMMTSIEAATDLVASGAETYMRLYEAPLPIVAACGGHAMAGGALLLLACDTRVGARGEFKIGLNEVAISLTLPVLAQELARDRLAPQHLVEATLQAKVYEPEGALRVGYFDRLAEPAEVVAEALKEARRLSQLPRLAYANTKKRLRRKTIQYIRDTLESDLKELVPG